jgi:small subunit ribosomal protein S20
LTGRLRFSRAVAFEPAHSNPLFPEIPNVANIKSAKKRAKQTIVRNARNVAQRSMLRTAVKKVIKALGAHDAKAAQDAFAAAQPLLDRMSARGLIHKNKAARHKSRLTARIKALQAA